MRTLHFSFFLTKSIKSFKIPESQNNVLFFKLQVSLREWRQCWQLFSTNTEMNFSSGMNTVICILPSLSNLIWKGGACEHDLRCRKHLPGIHDALYHVETHTPAVFQQKRLKSKNQKPNTCNFKVEGPILMRCVYVFRYTVVLCWGSSTNIDYAFSVPSFIFNWIKWLVPYISVYVIDMYYNVFSSPGSHGRGDYIVTTLLIWPESL